MKIIDLRSDTVTKPTDEMRIAMAKAPVGDDVYGEDPTINLLEETVAKACGMEDSIFTTSGTMGNQCAIMAHVNRSDEIICEDRAHILLSEGGSVSGLSGAQPRPIKAPNGILTPELIEDVIRDKTDIHQPYTKLICLENTHNHGGGTYYELSNLEKIRALADKNNLKIHMDGARVMNAAVALGVDISEITQYVDSVSICLSKGLCAPVGAMVAGTKEYIYKVRRARKSVGGGMRQAGILAAAGLIAFNDMPKVLKDDHKRAYNLAKGCSEIGFDIDMSSVVTNIVMVPFKENKQFIEELKKEGVLANTFGKERFRFVTHYGISDEDIDFVLEKLRKVKNMF